MFSAKRTEYAMRRESIFRELKIAHSEWSMEFEAGKEEAAETGLER